MSFKLTSNEELTTHGASECRDWLISRRDQYTEALVMFDGGKDSGSLGRMVLKLRRPPDRLKGGEATWVA